MPAFDKILGSRVLREITDREIGALGHGVFLIAIRSCNGFEEAQGANAVASCVIEREHHVVAARMTNEENAEWWRRGYRNTLAQEIGAYSYDFLVRAAFHHRG